MSDENYYPCVGICQSDPDSGYCIGCGRPPLDSPAITIAVEPANATHTPPDGGDPDTPA